MSLDQEKQNKTISNSVSASSSSSSSSTSSSKTFFEDIVKLYWTSKPWATDTIKHNNELECRFGSRIPLTRIDFENVAKTLTSQGFVCLNDKGETLLRINPSRKVNRSSKDTIPSSQRIEIKGKYMVQKFCEDENLDLFMETYEDQVKCYRKMKFRKAFTAVESEIEDVSRVGGGKDAEKKSKSKGTHLESQDRTIVVFEDFNFKIAYNVELSVSEEEMLDLYHADEVKFYRYMNRMTFVRADLPFRIDLSVVKMAKGKSTLDADLFTADSQCVYEIEIEVDNKQMGTALDIIHSPSVLVAMFRKTIKYVLMGLQETQFPIALSEQWIVLEEYKQLTGVEYFIGPNSCTLQRENIFPEKDDDNKKTVQQMNSDKEDIDPQDYMAEKPNKRVKNHAAEVETIKILNDYCVTDKADGERHLLFVTKNLKLYLIKQSMKVVFTGCQLTQHKFAHTLLDGELILNDKSDVFINLFAAFDIYYVGNAKEPKSPIEVKSFAFSNVDLGAEGRTAEQSLNTDKLSTQTSSKLFYRMDILKSVLKEMIIVGPGNTTPAPMMFAVKTFLFPGVGKSIFQCSKEFLMSIMPYNTDGLIFTPCNLGVGENKEPALLMRERKGKVFREAQEEESFNGDSETNGYNQITTQSLKPKRRWDYSFKWKPKSHNSVDFVVSTWKGDDGTDIIHTKMESEKMYKTVVLMCGYTRAQEKLDPRSYVLFGTGAFDLGDEVDLTMVGGAGRKPTSSYQTMISPMELKSPQHNRVASTSLNSHYRLRPFVPTDPYDPDANLVEVELVFSNNRQLVMLTESGERFEDNDVVEFRFDTCSRVWVPMRLRVDKMQGERFGNNFTTANMNWKSIHYTVTEEMMTTGKMVDMTCSSEETQLLDCYYKRQNQMDEEVNNDETKPLLTSQKLRKFHNFIKRKLYQLLSKKGDTLLELACGKAGDLLKWVESKLSFVFGIDIAQDNIVNRDDGAYARYLSQCFEFNHRDNKMVKRQRNSSTSMLFVHGNICKNIRDAQCCYSKEDTEITKSLFAKDFNSAVLGKDFRYRHMKRLDISQGFKLVSCQFALHYFFKDLPILQSFLDNVSENTAVNGYFFGTCYDGERVHSVLKDRTEVKVMDDSGKLIWKIEKHYKNKGQQESDENEEVDEEEEEPVLMEGGKGKQRKTKTSIKKPKKKQTVADKKKAQQQQSQQISFPTDERCLGMKISVFQDSINQLIDEYLVSFEYFTREMQDRGFRPLSDSELESLQLPHTCSFEAMLDLYTKECGMQGTYDHQLAQISNLNRFFIFKKVMDAKVK